MCNISVLVPVFNTEKYLKQCLDSVANQSIDNMEIICINDGSTDNSLDMLTEYANKDNRFKIIDKENSGYGHSMNVGIKTAKGEYIGIVESDDFVDRNMFVTLYELAKVHDADLVKSNFWAFKDGKDTLQNVLQNEPFKKKINPRRENKSIFLRGQSIWTGIYKREFLLENNIRFLETPGASYQDTSFFFITMACANSVVLIEDAFLHYRQDNPDSSVMSKEKVYCVCEEIDAVWRFLKGRPELEAELKYVVPVFQWIVYKWNLNRLNSVQKYYFLEKMYDDFKLLSQKGLLKKEFWNDFDAYNMIQRMVNCEKTKFLVHKYINDQLILDFKNNFLSGIRGMNVFVYGAGKIGELIVRYLKENNVVPCGIVVSSVVDNPEILLGCKVTELKDFYVEENMDSVLIVAVKEESQYPIIRDLLGKGFKNVIALNNELIFALLG